MGRLEFSITQRGRILLNYQALANAYVRLHSLIEGPQLQTMNYVPKIVIDSLYCSGVWDEVVNVVFSIECYRSFQNSVEELSTVGSTMWRSEEVNGVKARSQLVEIRIMLGKNARLGGKSALLRCILKIDL